MQLITGKPRNRRTYFKKNLDGYFRLIEFVSTEGLGTKLSLNHQTVEPESWLIIGSKIFDRNNGSVERALSAR